MKKSIIYSIIAYLLYISLIYFITQLSYFILVRETFININLSFFELIETFTYLLLIILIVLFFKKKEIQWNKNISKKIFLLVIILSLLYRIFEDPFLRIITILDHTRLPSNQYELPDFFTSIIIFFNIVILASVFEELFFRKLMLSFFHLKNRFFGVLLSSILFASIHIDVSHFSYIILSTSFTFSVIVSIIYFKYGIVYSILFHSFYNLLWYFFKLNDLSYWGLIFFNFDYRYWLIVALSIIIILFLMNSSKIKCR